MAPPEGGQPLQGAMQTSKGKAVPPGSGALACEAWQKRTGQNFQGPLVFQPNLWPAANGLIFLEQSYEKMGRKFLGPFLDKNPRNYTTPLDKTVQTTTNLGHGENGWIFMQQSYEKVEEKTGVSKCEQPLRNHTMLLT